MSKPVYLMAQFDVKDHQQYYDEYGSKVLQQLKNHNAEIIIATPKVEVKEGQWPANWTIMAKFASEEAAMGWYESEEYLPFIKLRQDKLVNSGSVIMFPAVR